MQQARQQSVNGHYPGRIYHFAKSGTPPEEDQEKAARAQLGSGEDLPYRVEVWDSQKTAVEQTLAMTANGSIGYAAYYEATKEYPTRYVTLRHKNRVVARWNPPGH